MKRIAPLLLSVLLLASCSITHEYKCIPGHDRDVLLKNTIRILAITNGIDTEKLSYCVADSQDVNAAIDVYGAIMVTTALLRESYSDFDFLKCAIAHELAHYKLNHVAKGIGLSVGTSVILTVADVFVPGIGYANHVINPTICSAYSRSKELDADIEAINICKNFGMDNPSEKYLQALQKLSRFYPDQKKSIWATHPAWDDRIEAVRKAYP